MKRPEYVSRYLFDWDLLEVALEGKSSFDLKSFVGTLNNSEQIQPFLEAYGFNQSDPILKAEIFGTFQEAIQFIKRYFLKEGNEEGLDFSIPRSFSSLTDVADLFGMAIGVGGNDTYEEGLWAQIILKVMHTILHVDKDIRYNYFSQIQQQIFDRFYKYISRDGDGALYLGDQSSVEKIKLADFETKSKKARDSTIIKLLHKEENVTEEVFDRIGVRFVTLSKLDCLRVIRFLYQNNVIIVHNIKPSRSRNSLIDLDFFKREHYHILRMALRNDLSEERFHQALNREIKEPEKEDKENNVHSRSSYKSIQFTGRHLIRYSNPFANEFMKLRSETKETLQEGENPLAQKIMNLDHTLITKEVRFFYPFEIQIVDKETQKNNLEGEAAHQEYKKGQLKSAMLRLFGSLIEYKEI
ncbi:MAG: TIGR04552 family protein [Bacteriovoracales bacterium]|nr:TIGR04552 family protein [Bacteriovoracales bacterium]